MRSITHNGFTWHDLVAPTEEELRILQQEHGFHDLDIEDCLSEQERPKIDEYDDYMFLVLHIPFVSGQTRRVIKEEINLFVGNDFLVTVNEGGLPFFDKMYESLAHNDEERAKFLGSGVGFFLYEIINTLYDAGFPVIDDINRQLRSMDANIFESEKEKSILRGILEIKRNIIAMRQILLPQRTVVSALEHKSRRFVPEELDVYFDDVQDAVERQWALLETAKEVAEALQDTHETWIQSKTNRIIRILTIFSVTMLPLTVITGFYGMNVQLPHAEHPFAAVEIFGVLMVILLGALTYFWKRKWL